MKKIAAIKKFFHQDSNRDRLTAKELLALKKSETGWNLDDMAEAAAEELGVELDS